MQSSFDVNICEVPEDLCISVSSDLGKERSPVVGIPLGVHPSALLHRELLEVLVDAKSEAHVELELEDCQIGLGRTVTAHARRLRASAAESVKMVEVHG